MSDVSFRLSNSRPAERAGSSRNSPSIKAACAGAGASLLLLFGAGAAFAQEQLVISSDTMSVFVPTPEGLIEITRHKNDTMMIGGVLQPMVPVPGVTPVGELEVLAALEQGTAVVVDMRTIEWRAEATIPGSVHIPYTEVASRLDELGCSKTASEVWDCANAEPMIAFCNGPACGQSPLAIKAMVREGFPVEKIAYYRGGMQSWTVLGLTVSEGLF